MYKSTARGLRRATGVHRIAPQRGALAEDYLPEPTAMTMAELVAERGQLSQAIARIENEAAVAKRRGHYREASSIMAGKKPLEHRMGEVNDRLRLHRRVNVSECWKQACAELCDEELACTIYARVIELEREQTA